jgi:isocitrate/isopropylmalate dehydrogenase
MKPYSIAAIPGDVIGTEVIAAGIAGRRNASSNIERILIAEEALRAQRNLS